MVPRRAILSITAGPNAGDSVSLELGSCRLVGRHLSENETTLIDRDGNRLLDDQAVKIVADHLRERTPPLGTSPQQEFSLNAFDRGPDVIFADDSISRAHVMIFLDQSGLGIIDLASTNGTYVNHERIGAVVAHDGDLINIGQSEMSLKIR